MPRKPKVSENITEEPVIKVLTSEEIKEKFTEADYFRIVKQCVLKSFENRNQHDAIWLENKSGELNLIIKDKAFKKCSFFGTFEGAKFEVVLDDSFFYRIKSFFSESSNEKNNSTSKFDTSSNSSVPSLQKV